MKFNTNLYKLSMFTDTRFQWFTPVLIIEDSEGNITHIPSVHNTVNCDGGICVNDITLDILKTVLKPYLV